MNTNPAETQVISVPDGSIRDYVDGKVRKDTPEEYVRQTINGNRYTHNALIRPTCVSMPLLSW